MACACSRWPSRSARVSTGCCWPCRFLLLSREQTTVHSYSIARGHDGEDQLVHVRMILRDRITDTDASLHAHRLVGVARRVRVEHFAASRLDLLVLQCTQRRLGLSYYNISMREELYLLGLHNSTTRQHHHFPARSRDRCHQNCSRCALGSTLFCKVQGTSRHRG